MNETQKIYFMVGKEKFPELHSPPEPFLTLVLSDTSLSKYFLATIPN